MLGAASVIQGPPGTGKTYTASWIYSRENFSEGGQRMSDLVC